MSRTDTVVNPAALVSHPDGDEVVGHAHRWRIEEQAGALSAGRCECGEEQSFHNGWDGDMNARLRGGSWMDRKPREMGAPR